MRKLLLLIFFWICFSFAENSYQLYDIKGRVRATQNKTLNIAKGFYIPYSSHSLQDSVFISQSQFQKILKKEYSPNSQYYLRTNIFAVNGIGYKNRKNAEENFKTLFSYCKNELQNEFPEDTISTDIIFNPTSGNKFNDLIQTIVIQAENGGIDPDKLHIWDLLAVSPTIYFSTNSPDLQYVATINLIADLIKEATANSAIHEVNEITKENFKKALMQSNENKSRAIVIGHSQGGMYTELAFNSFSDEEKLHYYSLNIGGPTDKNPNWYFINENDFIVNIARILNSTIPQGEENSIVSASGYVNENETWHAWLDSYYNPNLSSYSKINESLKTAFSSTPYWEKLYGSLDYNLLWYNGAAETTIEILLKDGSFKTLGTYQGYSVIDPTIIHVDEPQFENGLPIFRVSSFHHGSEWGPYLSNNPAYFRILQNEENLLVYLMSDAWSPNSFDDAEFQIALKLLDE